MYCRNCGNQMPDQAVVCVQCGVPKGQGSNYCPNCGEKTDPQAAVCVRCGVNLFNSGAAPIPGQKSMLAAGLLGIFLGGLGIHNFYLGFTTKAIIQLLVSVIGGVITCGAAAVAMSIWGLVEGIMILTGSINKDASGAPLGK